MNLRFNFLLCLSVFACCPGIAQLEFAPQQILNVSPENAERMFSADIDGDGDQDMIVSDNTTDDIAWFDNDGTGLFQCKHLIYAIASSAPKLAGVADFDQDGDTDVVMYNQELQWIAWFQNDGAGNFSAPISILTEAENVWVVDMNSGDLNADGYMDLMYYDYQADELFWLKNTGEGEFYPPASIATSSEYLSIPTVADADQDGDMDVFCFNSNADLLVYYSNNGDDTFAATPVEVGIVDHCPDFAVNDLDGDDFPEVVAASYNAELYKVFPNDATGQFEPPFDLGVVAGNPRSVCLADTDQDGDLDVLCAGGNSPFGFFLAENTGSLSFDIQTLISSNDVISISHLHYADLDGNGIGDPICYESQRSRIAFVANEGAGNFGNEHVYAAGPYVNNDTEVGDLDGDGDMDVVISSVGNNRQDWYERNADGSYNCSHQISISIPKSEQEELIDTDNDGDLDLVLLNTTTGEVFLLSNDGLGNFGEPQVIAETSNSLTYSTFLASGDLNGDGYTDVVGTVTGIYRFFWLQNPGGSGEWVKHDIANGDLSSYKAVVQCVDVNVDGSLDLVTHKKHTGEILYLQNTGSGAFLPPVVWGTVNDIHDFECVDLNGDGQPDIAATSDEDETLSILYNDGSGNLLAPVIVSNAIKGDQLIESADLDLDGDVDLVTNGYNGSTPLFWFENLGEGLFAQHTEGPYPSLSSTFRLADIDLDGDTDILYASSVNVMLLENLLDEGCTDPTACNYNPIAIEDNGSCCYENCGCTNENASNYDPEAVCDDGSCKSEVSGHVFHDVDADGNWDSGEPTLPNQQVSIPALGVDMLTNDEGYFECFVNPGFIELNCATTEAFPYNSTPNPLYLETISDPTTELEFGLSTDFPFSDIDVHLFPTEISFCDDWIPYSVCIHNQGNYAYDGYVALATDSLYQGFEAITPIDSIADGLIYLSFNNLGAGETQCLGILVHTPTADHIGEMMTSTAYAYGLFEDEVVAYGEDTLEMEVTCAYDPNDKLAFPQGFTDDHLILGEEEIDFVVRFQNTGNAPAGNILIRDTLDVGFDWNSFQLIGNSHSVVTTLNAATREVTFFFENILLPDSTCCEEESHGFVSYQIRPLPDLSAGTVLENTAYIYFDNNEPIVTNTTWHTIHECTEELNFTVSETPVCLGSSAEVTSDYNFDIAWETAFAWEYDGEIIDQEATLTLGPTSVIEGTVILTATNPLCAEQGWLPLTFNNEFTWTTCPGDLNCDLAVDAIDVLTFLGDYDCNGPACAYDFDGDGVASSSDLLIVIGVYGVFCE